jgi:2-polyprenyl-3-methyl-5-hydroxy-6-metoxy-1,4-benzoquinol methylase
VQFHVRDAARLDAPQGAGPAGYDLITAFDAIHDQANPAAVLRAIARALRPGGTFLMQDIRASSHLEKNTDNPLAPFIFTVSCMHCMTVSLAQGGAGLGAAWGEELALQMLAEAGFGPVEVKRLEHDIMNNYYIVHG